MASQGRLPEEAALEPRPGAARANRAQILGLYVRHRGPSGKAVEVNWAEGAPGGGARVGSLGFSQGL